MTKFKKLLAIILFLLSSSLSLVSGEMNAETVYEFLSKRIDDVSFESRTAKTQMAEMGNKYNSLKLQIANMNKPSDSLKLQLKTIDSRLNSLEHKMDKMETRFAKFEESVTTLEGSIEATQNDTRPRKLENHIKRIFNSQASAVRRVLAGEKMILRKSVEHFDNMFQEHKADIQFQMSDFIRTINTDFEAANDSFVATTRDLTEVVNNNSREVENRYRELSADIKSVSEDWGLRLGNTENILKTEIEQTNMELDLRVKNTSEAINSLSSRISTVSSSLSSKISSETSSLSSRISSESSSLSSRISSESSSLSSRISSESSSLSSRISSLSERISKEENRKVAFTARLTNADSYYVKNERIDFNEISYSYGYGYDSSTGIFTAPLSGTYLFIFGVESTSAGLAQLGLMINGFFKIDAYVKGADGGSTSSVVQYVNAGEKVWIETMNFQERYYLFSYRTHFTGILID